MEREKIALGALVIIIVAVLSFYLISSEGIFDDFLSGEEKIELGDCADVHYIAKYESNDTVFMSSYDNPEEKTDGNPLNVYVTTNKSANAPTNYSNYYPGILSLILDQNNEYMNYLYTPLGVRDGFIEELVGLKEGETSTTDIIQAKNAFGVSPKVGDLLLASLPDYGMDINFSIFEINYDQPVSAEYEQYIDTNTTTMYILRDESYHTGKVLNYVNNTVSYPCWTNFSVVDEVEDTYVTIRLNPSTEVGENFTWSVIEIVNPSYGMSMQTSYPTNSSKIITLNNSTIVVKHTPQQGDQITMNTLYQSQVYQSTVYTVQNVTATKINTTYSTDGTAQNMSYHEFNRTTIIDRIYTQDITQPIPEPLLEEQLLFFLRAIDEDFIYGLSDYADKNIYFEITVEEIYKTS